MKLVIVMGLTWVADVMSWCIGGPNYLWYATDLINALQGLFIFLVVGCQPQVNYRCLTLIDFFFVHNIVAIFLV
jgi:G protein-coupled receptor Mth (Methuselah protein)